MKKIICFGIACITLSSFSLNISVQKTRGLTSSGENIGESIFRDCHSRHFYEIKISGANVKDLEHSYKIRVLPILKFCKGGSAIPYFMDIVEETEIVVDPRKSYTCVYISPLTKWTKDTWTDVGGDWSKGIVMSSVFIELDKDGKPVKTWTNCPITAFRNARSIEDGKNKLKTGFMSWLEDSVNDKIETYIEEKSRIESNTTWKNMIAKHQMMSNVSGQILCKIQLLVIPTS